MNVAEIADRIPGTEHALEALGLQRVDSSLGVGRLAAAFGLGVAIGVGLGALLTPLRSQGEAEEADDGGREGTNPYG
jgi:hypothetical protein